MRVLAALIAALALTAGSAQAKPGSTDPRGASPPWPAPLADRPGPEGVTLQVPGRSTMHGAHDAEASTDHRRIQAKPRCYGAAARDPHKHCTKEAKTVTPTPDEAVLTPNIACTRGEVGDMATSCAVGVPAESAVATVAMLGDSHAAHWRATMEAVARKKKWRVLEIARPHCPFSFASPAPTEAGAGDCVAWNQRIIDWLAANPGVATVFISNNARLPMAQRDFAYRLDGFVRAFGALPATVTRAIVLRDPPSDRASSHDCVTRALKHRWAPGRHCAVPRSRALVRDAGISAAQQLGGRFETVDLTKFFCDRKHCFPVVGGVLVHKDADHLTQDFAATLGPYLLRAIGG